MNQSETERFLDFVDRLVGCTDVAGVQLGVVYTTDEEPRVLSLHAELVEQAGSTEPRRFAADAIGAFSCVEQESGLI